MTQETTEAEPPDPHLNYNPRNLNYTLNGRGQYWRPTPFEEATGPDGTKFVRKIGTSIIYEITAPSIYVCLECKTPTSYEMTSRTVTRGPGKESHIKCEPHRFCPKCEERPRKTSLETINESELLNH